MKTIEENREYKRQWRLKNPEKVKESSKRYRDENSEKVKESSKRYRDENSEKVKESSKRYRLKNPEKQKEKSKRYRDENPEKQKKTQLRNKYGITLEQYQEMLTEQLSGCSICGKLIFENGKALAIDHNHNTKKVRKLLCSQCNSMLGYSKENPDTLIQGAIYLLKHQDEPDEGRIKLLKQCLSGTGEAGRDQTMPEVQEHRREVKMSLAS
jgi:predicted ATP-dependent endonuclease of OLD family